MFQRIITLIDQVFRRYTPDPFLIAVFLTFAVLGLAWGFTDFGPLELIRQWGEGFWNLIAFTLQMVMILIGGYLIASSPPVQKLLTFSTQLVRSPVQAIVATTLISCFASWLNWGLGLVVGAFVAVEFARRIPGAQFRILVASAYTGFILWHGGLSGSIPLLVNTPGNFSEKWVGGLIPVSETLFSSMNIAALSCLVLVLPVLNVWMSKGAQAEGLPPDNVQTFPSQALTEAAGSPAERLENSRWLMLLMSALGLAYLVLEIRDGRFGLDLNRMNFIFLFLGILLHGSPRAFLKSVGDAASKVGPILIQYPFYGGIMGVMTASGLAAMVSELFVSIASPATFPLLSFYSAGLVNFFVPSGGGQWAVQGPIIIPAAQAVGADLAKSVMAVAWGDAWTNLAQPFWALPLLSIAGLQARDIMGYCIAALVVSGAVLSIVFLVFSTP